MMGVSRVKALKTHQEVFKMNCTRTELENQRIERITRAHVVVGIDIAKEKHAAQITDYRGRVLTARALSFPNTAGGFEALLRWIQEVLDQHKKRKVLVGMEPTGHYWHNLADWLLDVGIEVVLVNPVTTHRNKENRDNSPSKNDPKDALVIADVVTRGYYTEYTPHQPEFEHLKRIISEREFWVNYQSGLRNRIVRWLDMYFPEFTQVFKEWDGTRALATLRAFPLPADVMQMDAEAIVQGWVAQGMKRAGGVSGKAKASSLLHAAARSIGKAAIGTEAHQEIRRLLEGYADVQERLGAIEQEFEGLLVTIPLTEPLRSVGLGSITIAYILGCAGDLRYYAHGQQLLRRAGLNLTERTSGKHKGQIKLSKRGDSTLRKVLFLAVLQLVRHQPDFKLWHARYVQRGMGKMQSIVKLMGKLARILIGMVQRGETYRSPEQAILAA